jgi:trk system potassium uptake protein TrkA
MLKRLYVVSEITHTLEKLDIFGEGVIDIPISPEDEITTHLKELIDHPGANQIESFANGKVKLVSVKAKKKGKLVGRELKGIKEDMPDIDAFVAAPYTEKEILLYPTGDTIIKENDEIYFISSESNIGPIVDEFRDHEEQYSRIMIVGGGKVGFSLAKDIEKDYNVKLIDSDDERCKVLSKELEKTIVLNGSATDESLLKSENIANIDIFCALTDDDETNVMSSLLAKKMGAKKTMIILKQPILFRSCAWLHRCLHSAL